MPSINSFSISPNGNVFYDNGNIIWGVSVGVIVHSNLYTGGSAVFNNTVLFGKDGGWTNTGIKGIGYPVVLSYII
jgi:hypothetical protein